MKQLISSLLVTLASSSLATHHRMRHRRTFNPAHNNVNEEHVVHLQTYITELDRNMSRDRRQATLTRGRQHSLLDCGGLSSKECGEEWVLEQLRNERGEPRSVEYELHRALMRGYEKSVRPTAYHSDPVYVEVSIFLYQVIKLDQQRNTIKVSGSFELYWIDKFLQWNPQDYDNATEIFLSSTAIWTPEFSQYYSHSQEAQVVVMKTDNDLRLNHTGHVRYYVPFSSEAMCPINVQYFPFDWQVCQLFFGSWAHNNQSITYKIYYGDGGGENVTKNGLQLGDFYNNQEWTLHENFSNATTITWKYDYLSKPEYWSVIKVVIVVERTWFYYVFNLVMPSTIIVLVAIIGFHSPSTSGRVRDAKFRLGIMTLMSMSVILLAVVEGMPKFDYKNSETPPEEGSNVTISCRKNFSGIPLIGIYYVFLLTTVAASTVTTSLFVFLDRKVS